MEKQIQVLLEHVIRPQNVIPEEEQWMEIVLLDLEFVAHFRKIVDFTKFL